MPRAKGPAKAMESIVKALDTNNDLGYWITKVDGNSDDSTRQGIIAFQNALDVRPRNI